MSLGSFFKKMVAPGIVLGNHDPVTNKINDVLGVNEAMGVDGTKVVDPNNTGLTPGFMNGAPSDFGPAPAPTSAFNPFAQFQYTPGIGYSTGSTGVNPFANIAQSIPTSFFQNPKAIEALFQILNRQYQNPAPAAPATPAAPAYYGPTRVDGVPQLLPQVTADIRRSPGPAPDRKTALGAVGGFGNGGGKMGLQNRWVRAL